MTPGPLSAPDLGGCLLSHFEQVSASQRFREVIRLEIRHTVRRRPVPTALQLSESY